jgi:Fe-S cluster assembly protein SufB
MWRVSLFKRKVLNPRFNFYLDKIIKFNFSIFGSLSFQFKNMPKYTEDDLKSNSKLKNMVLYRTRSGYFSHWLERRYCSCYFDEKEEPQWMTGVSSLFVLEMTEPEWANVHYAKPDFQAISYYSAPKRNNKTLDDVDPEL